MSARNGHDGCALVTGGTRGIGAAIAQRLGEDGFRTVTLGRTSGDVQADVGDPASVEAAFGAGFVWGAGIVSWKERVHVCA